ncbi:hypothetical protein UlMin_034934 [Ulmus minor]
MALPASISLSPSSSPKFLSKLFGHHLCQVKRSTLLSIRRQTFSKCSMRVSMSQFGEPDKVKMQIGVAKEKFLEAIPDSVKDVPWEKAADILIERLLVLGKELFKWAFILWFSFSSLSDVILSISRNQELMMPIGLLIGCLMADFLKETSQELFHSSEGKGLDRNLIGIGCFFVLLKFAAAYFGTRGKFFLLHAGNGGLMQVLWLWKNLLNGRSKSNEEKPFSVQDSSLAIDERD